MENARTTGRGSRRRVKRGIDNAASGTSKLVMRLCSLCFAVFSLIVCRPAFAGPVYERVATFQLRGAAPGNGRLCAGPGGYYWGVTQLGGMNYNGTVYKVKADGTGMRIVALVPQ